MHNPRYNYHADEALYFYEFFSEGPAGRIRKLVEYTPTSQEGVYNLAFGDWDETTGGLNDKTRSNNGDRQKVLATVMSTVYAFTGRYPDAWVFALGSTDGRTRLYQIGIAQYLDEATADFIIYSLSDEQWMPFERDRNYDAFLVTRRNRKFEL